MKITPNTIGVNIGVNGVNAVVKKVVKACQLQETEPERFCSGEMQMARQMNKIAIYDLYKTASETVPAKASSKDAELLMSEKYEDSQNRAVWVNPKTRKPYYLLKEDESSKGIDLRVLKSDGEYLKNIVVKPCKIILGDLAEGDNHITRILGMDFNHSDLIEIIARRYNPFAEFKTMKFKDDYDLIDLSKNLPHDTKYLELSYVIESKLPQQKKGSDIADEFINRINKYAPEEIEYLKKLNELTSQTRVLISAGNNGKDTINALLIKTGFEGVGGLNQLGKVDKSSASRNSYFTRHYEPFYYQIKTTPYGINLTGLRGTDIPLEHDYPDKKILHTFKGTSFSAPVRTSKLALNDMLFGLI